MANSHTQIYLQSIFAVKYRKALLDPAWRSRLFAVIGNILNEKECKNIIVNGVEDHVHCLFRLRPAISISELMKAVKARSSKYVNEHRLTDQRFEWQGGYGCFSYSKSSLNNVFRYIQNQEARHKKYSFRNEYVSLLNKFEIEYDPEYIFHDPI